MIKTPASSTSRPIQAMVPDDANHQVVAIGAASVASAAIGVELVRLVADTDCYISVGPAPVATAAKIFLPANAIDYLAVTPTQKIAVITKIAGTVGNLHITPAVVGA
ncbi:MAG: hypothetical protein JWO05_1139 [Gemmatimonadetes bacterium]|nr:hypothetical protein [Gemmatimonadota bacterium]